LPLETGKAFSGILGVRIRDWERPKLPADVPVDSALVGWDPHTHSVWQKLTAASHQFGAKWGGMGAPGPPRFPVDTDTASTGWTQAGK